MSRRCAVIGSPIAHSLSPAMHRAAYAALGLDWTYQAIEVPAGRVAEFVAGLDVAWRGLSVTMPLKPELLQLPRAEVSDNARRAGVGNTVILDEDRLRVDNTDIGGFGRALQRRLPGHRFAEAVVVGSGASARSAMIGLADAGTERIWVTARSAHKIVALGPLADELRVDLRELPWGQQPPDAAELVISTLPGGSLDDAHAALLARVPVLFDISYHPWPSTLAHAAADGVTVLDGLELLADQAVLQLELMTGRTVPAELLSAAARAELAGRG
ncbi:shikimate dehydrogenase [Naumannella halotolerans]|uniref:shikimate dehydrogenase n=1 Tax=Naumannella halotolerans TaxID=993414 RepID=UPI00370D4063